jgi:PKD repeat protein
MIMADLNGDGLADLVTANESGSSITVLLATGNGTFAPGVTISVGVNVGPKSIAAADLNRDGKIDLVVAQTLASGVAVLLGNGDGTFQAPRNFATGSGPRAVALGDLNGDGKPDLLVTCDYTQALEVYMGNGDGTFSVKKSYAMQVNLPDIKLADLNGDGKLDVAIANYNGQNISVLLNNGDGTLGPIARYSAPNSVRGIACADLNHDGKIDLVSANFLSNNVSVFLNQGAGTFVLSQTIATEFHPTNVAVADLNHDGNLDIVAVNSVSNSVSVMLGSANGTFSLARNFSGGAGPQALALGNFIGNGEIDVALASASDSSVWILPGAGDGTFSALKFNPAQSMCVAIAEADFNGDGITDFAVLNKTNASVSVFLGLGNGLVAPAVNYALAVGSNPGSIAAGDINGNGHIDLAIAEYNGNCVALLMGNGDGTFQPAPPVITSTLPVAVALADITGDGKLDLLVTCGGTQAVEVYSGNGNGTFTFFTRSGPMSQNLARIVVADVNKDGKPDVLVANYLGGGFHVLLNTGGGTLAAPVKYLAKDTSRMHSITTADFNGDGFPDVAVCGEKGSAEVFLNAGNGTFPETGHTAYATGQSLEDIVAADFSGDGIADLVVCNHYSSSISVFLGDGTGHFGAPRAYKIGEFPNALVFGDYNADGKRDLAIAQENSGLLLLLNIGSVQRQDQAITFGTLSNKTYGDLPFALTATASSGLPVSFTVISGPASISNNTLTITGAGSVTVRAAQAGNSQFNPAPNVDRTFTVAKKGLGISADNKSKVYGAALPVLTVSYVGFVNGDTPSVLNPAVSISTTALATSPAGTYPIHASGAAAANYTISFLDGILTITKATPVLLWGNPADIAFGTPLSGTQLNASANVPGTFVYTPAAGTVLPIGNNQNLTVVFTPNDALNYSPLQKSVTINVFDPSLKTQTITFAAISGKTFGDAPFALSATASSGLPVSFSIVNGPASISANTLTIKNAGTVTVRASQAGNAQYLPAPNVDRTFTVAKATPVITWNTPADIAVGTPLSATQLNATASVAGSFSYTPAAGTILLAGTQQLNVTFAPTDGVDYNSASASVKINVVAVNHPPTVSAGGSPLSGYAPLTVSFSATASDADGDTLTFTWSFGDGSPTASGQSPSHVFSVAGVYTVSVSVDDGHGGTASSSVTVKVLSGGGLPGTPGSTPKPLNVLKFTAALKSSGSSDACAISGSLAELPAGFTTKGARIDLNVGGAIVTFTLDAKGRAKTGSSTFALTQKTKHGNKHTPSKLTIGFAAKLKNGAWLNVWQQSGIDPANGAIHHADLPVTIQSGETVYSANVAVQITGHSNGKWLVKK